MTANALSHDLRQQLAALPTLSAKVLRTLLDGLYAEPGFSDVVAEDIATTLNVAKSSMGGAIAHLTDENLVDVEEVKINGRTQKFLHSSLHTDAAPELRQLAIDFLASLDETPAPTPTPKPTASKRDAKKARRIIRDYLRAAMWFAFAHEGWGTDEFDAARDAYLAASELLAALDGYGREG